MCRSLPILPVRLLSIRSDVIARDPAVLRDLLEIRPAGPELGVEDVEAPASLVQAVYRERDVAGFA